jgi:phage terminase small subunit
MGKRGKAASGGKRTQGKSPLPAADFAPTNDISPGAQNVWKQLVAVYPAGHFAETDRILLEQFCEAAALHRTSTAGLAKGRYYRDERGIWRKHPATEDQRQARQECAMLATKLRLTKQATISPKVAGRAAADAAAYTELAGSKLGELLFYEDDQHISKHVK